MATIVNMKTTAAILVEAGRPLEVADLKIPQLKSGQVLVRLAYSGVCHTQLLECRGYRGEDRFLPHCLGHEGSGTVIDVGPDVTKCCVDDRVILSWIKGSGGDVPGSTYDWNGQTVNAGGVTSFMTHAVVAENRVGAGGRIAGAYVAHLARLQEESGAAFLDLNVDEIDHEVRWNSGGNVSDLAGTVVRLQFSLRNARLFAFQFEGRAR